MPLTFTLSDLILLLTCLVDVWVPPVLLQLKVRLSGNALVGVLCVFSLLGALLASWLTHANFSSVFIRIFQITSTSQIIILASNLYLLRKESK